MNCRKVQHLLSAYIDSELTGMEMISIRRHIDTCEVCRREYRSILAVKKCYGLMMLKRPLTESLASQICGKINNQNDAQPRSMAMSPFSGIFSTFLRYRFYAISVGVILLFIAIGASDINTSRQPDMAQYNVGIDSIIGNDRFASANLNDDVFGNTGAPVRTSNFNLPWGLSHKQTNPQPYGNNVQVLLASYH